MKINILKLLFRFESGVTVGVGFIKCDLGTRLIKRSRLLGSLAARH